MKITPTAQRFYTYVPRPIAVLVITLSILFLLPDRTWNQFWPGARAATTFTVNSLADTPDAVPGNGLCADAGGACTLRAALQEANSLAGNDTINFSVTGTINLTGVLPTINSTITINGPGSGSLTVRRDTGGDYRIFFTDNAIVSVSGMTITNGKSPDGAAGSGQPGGPGGGIRQGGGTLTLNDVIITANRTGAGGTISNNDTAGRGGNGGGIDGSGVLTITNSVISNNITGNGATGFSGGTGGEGGGLFFTGTTLTMTNVKVTGNTTGNAGTTTSGGLGGNGGSAGGMHVTATTTNLTRVNIDNNIAGNGDDGGDAGGLFLVSGVATIVNSTINNNSSGQGGDKFAASGGTAGGLLSFAQVTMTGSSVSGNITKAATRNGGQSGGLGGGIFNGNTLTMINSTVSNNQASPFEGRGGGIYNTANALTLTNVTITGNSAYTCCTFQNGQGLHNANTAIVRNTIIAGNGIASVPDVTGIFTSQGNNLIGKATGGGNGDNGDQTGFTNGVNGDQVGTLAAPIDAKLGALANNGGPSPTHKLLSGSPALDAGNDALARDASDNTLTSDQRGAGRFANSAGPGTGTVDIGAYEFHFTLENFTNKTTNQNVALPITFSVGDNVTGITVTAASSNTTLVPNANLALSGDGTVRTLVMTPALNQFGSTLISVAVFSGGNPMAGRMFMLTVNAVNQAPTFTPGANQTTNEDAGAQSVTNWATNISPGPSNESAQTLTFQVTGNSNPGLFAAAPAISSTGTLTYTAAANVSGSATIDVVLKDNGGTANGGQDTSTTASFSITVNPVNDAPSFTKGANQTVNEDSGFQFVSNWATNISAGPNESQSLTFTVTNNTNPTLFSSGPAINTSGLSYSPAFNANGAATITVVLKDNGGTANGGQDTSAEQTFTITVNAVNDPPLNQFPFAPSTFRNTPLVFSTANFNPVSVSDVDAAGDAVQLTLTATSGTVSLSGVAGLTFTAGDGTDDATMTFSGTLTSINTALNGLTFKPTTDFTGFASIQMSTNDLGHNGSGGALTDTDTISINVRSGGVLQFSSSTFSVDESTTFAVITITRTGGNGGAASITYASSNGTATGGGACAAGVDYLSSGGTLSWADNDANSKSFAVPICADSLNESDETVNLTLSNLTGTATLGTRTTATLTITNDDPPVLLLEENSDRAIALDSISLRRDPFTLLNDLMVSSADNRRRISLFVWRLGLLPQDTAANVSALAEDEIGTPYPLVVESVSPVAGVPEVTQVVVKLPDNVIGIPRDLFVRVTLRGPGSNRGRISIAIP